MFSETTSIEYGSQAEILKDLDRARRAYGHFAERLDDRLIFKGDACVKHYSSGRLALVLHCELAFPTDFETVRVFGKVGLPIREKNFFSIILKADACESEHVEHWENKLVFIPDVHIVQGPEGVIPSFVGFYDVYHGIPDSKRTRIIGETLLFQSAINGLYQSLPLVKDWKPRPLIRDASGIVHSLEVEHVESTPEIVKHVTDDKSSVDSRKPGFINVNADVVLPSVFFDTHEVKVRFGKGSEPFLKVTDVLCGPFDLFCRCEEFH
jgi:hypothetical protein